jgi:hypothetical protein
LPKELDQHLKTYYDTAVRENRYYSEDWTFCENWRDMGGKIWVDKRVLLKHTGTYTFDFAAQEPLYQALHLVHGGTPTPPPQTVEAPAPAAPPTVLATNEATPVPAKKAKRTKSA